MSCELFGEKNIWVFLWILPFIASAQQKGKAAFYISPEQAILKVDSVKMPLGQTVELDSGKHVVKVWAPKRKLLTDTLYIRGGKYTTYSRVLPFTDEYKAYKKAFLKYRLRRIAAPATPLALLGGVVANSVIGYYNIQRLDENLVRQKEQIEDYAEQYEKSFSLIKLAENKEEFYAAKEAYYETLEERNKKTTRTLVVGAAGITATVISAFLLRRWVKKFEKPVYEEEPLLSKVNFGFHADKNKTSIHVFYRF